MPILNVAQDLTGQTWLPVQTVLNQLRGQLCRHRYIPRNVNLTKKIRSQTFIVIEQHMDGNEKSQELHNNEEKVSPLLEEVV